MGLDQETINHVINVLRRGTVQWPGRRDAFERASKKVWEGRRRKKKCKKSGKPAGSKIWKLFWQCAHCQEWFRDKTELECDHIVEVGPFLGNLRKWIEGLYCGADNLQILCVVCHQIKTNGYNATRRFKRKSLTEK